MDLAQLSNIGDLPFNTVAATAVWHLLGPSTVYLGKKGEFVTQKAVDNIERILKEAFKRLPANPSPNGAVPPRLLRAVIAEGAFTEDSIAAAYLGGVLASSRTDNHWDDRGVCINAMISRLSVIQLRLHYICYTAMHYLFQGIDTSFGEIHINHTNSMRFGTNGLLVAMGLMDEANDDTFIDSALSHALYGLSKEELICNWEFNWKSGLKCSPTPIGAELFLWANGHGRQVIEFFFDRRFQPTTTDGGEQISLVPGRSVRFRADDGEEVVVNGFDYCYYHDKMHCCKLPTIVADSLDKREEPTAV